MKIFLTGGTGFLGKHLVNALEPSVEKIYLLVRKEGLPEAQRTYKDRSKIQFVLGDITSPDVLDKEEDFKLVKKDVTHFVHAAALYNLYEDKEKCFLANVVGTQNILQLALQMDGLQYFHYISTIGISGDYEGTLWEDQLEYGQSFHDSYGQTKYQAEFLVRNQNLGRIKKRIYRPGIIVGDSSTGQMEKVDGPYYFFRLLSNLKQFGVLSTYLKKIPIPCQKDTRLPLVPIDKMAETLSFMIQNPQGDSPLRCYHLCDNEGPTTENFIVDALDFFSIKARLIPLPKNPANKLLMRFMGIPPEVMTYLYCQNNYDATNRHADYPQLSLGRYDNFKNSMFHFGQKMFSQRSYP